MSLPFPLKSSLEVSLDAICKNVDVLRGKLGGETRLLAILKSSAYGLNPKVISEALKKKGVNFIGVAASEEAYELRESGVTEDLFVLNSIESEFPYLIAEEMHMAVGEVSHLAKIEEEAKRQGKKARIHLHIDTGMGRFGCRFERAFSLCKKIHDSQNLELTGLMSHFPCADIPEKDPVSLSQVQMMKELIAKVETKLGPVPFKHIANSAGALRFNLPEFNLARVGIALYGLYSALDLPGTPPLFPALSLKTTLVGLNFLEKGDTACYGNAFTAKERSYRLGVIPLGYFHGFPTGFHEDAHVLIKGKKAPYLKRICMDQALVDLSEIEEAQIGDEVEIFGKRIPPETFSKWAGWIPHELITRVSPQVPVNYLGECKKI